MIEPAKDEFSAPRDHAAVLDVPEADYVMLDGEGLSSSPEFRRAIDAVTEVARRLRAAMRAEGADAHGDAPLEALWKWDEHHKAWHWTLMVRLPPHAPPHDLGKALRAAEAAAGESVRRVRVERYHEGRAVQMLHVGPYVRELKTLEKLHDELQRAGFVPTGPHHEIYLSNPEIEPSESLRTIVRQPVEETWIEG